MSALDVAGIPWPHDRLAAAAFTFDVDAESAVLWGSPGAATRMSVMSHQAYGPLVGVPRILALLRHHGILATFFVPGFTAHRYPDVVRRIVDEGHEVAHHGYLHEPPASMTPQDQVTALDRGLEALEAVAGVRPVGYRAPMWDLSWHTPRLLLERGFLYDSSLMDADAPYELAVANRSIVEIPVQWALDDWEQYCYLPELTGSGTIETPAKAAGTVAVGVRRAAGLRRLLGSHQPPLPQRPAIPGRGARRADDACHLPPGRLGRPLGGHRAARARAGPASQDHHSDRPRPHLTSATAYPSPDGRAQAPRPTTLIANRKDHREHVPQP